jgi:hypothetical protein
MYFWLNQRSLCYEGPTIARGLPMLDSPTIEGTAPHGPLPDLTGAAKDLNARQFRRLRVALAEQADLSAGRQVSRAGRVVRGAKTERKLVLFTLGILVGMIIVAVAALAIANKADTLATPLVTLAGTGMGFIGGLVRREADEPTDPKAG